MTCGDVGLLYPFQLCLVCGYLDEDAHGMPAGAIAILTFLLHTARRPPPGHEAVKYGVDPSTVTKLYRSMKDGVGSLLWDLVSSSTSTLKDFQGHFHRAVQAAEGDPLIQQRLSSHWMEMSQYFDSVEMLRSYYRKYLTLRSGRGLPKLVDEHIVMLVMCSEFERVRGCNSASNSGQLEAAAVMDRAMKVAETCKEAVSDLRSKVGDIKQDLNNLKTKVDNLKAESGKPPKGGSKDDRECTYCGKKGHTAEFCHTKIGDDAVKKAQAAAATSA